MVKITKKQHFGSTKQFHIFTDKQLGSGSFGKVILCIHISTCKLYALKIIQINLSKINNNIQLKLIQKQNHIHDQLDHPHIVKLWDHFVQHGYIYMIMDYVERGTLFSYQNTMKTFNQVQAFKYFFQTLQAVKYLHANDIMHRDIKPQNLLIDKDYNIKLCDFGWSTNNIQLKRTTFCGTYQYMAPQMIFQNVYNYKIDIWALGILLYQLLHGFAPFKGDSVNQVKNKMKIGQIYFNDQISMECKELITLILKFKPEERISIQQIQVNKWVKKMQRLLAKYYIQNQDHQIDFSTDKKCTKAKKHLISPPPSTNILVDKNPYNLYIQKSPNKQKKQQKQLEHQHTQSTSSNNYNPNCTGFIDHSQSVMVVLGKNNDNMSADKTKYQLDRLNVHNYQRNILNNKFNKVNMHKKTISATTFIQPDGDVGQVFQNKKNKVTKQKQKLKNNQCKQKIKQNKSKKQKQHVFKNFTTTIKNPKKNIKNNKQVTNIISNILSANSENDQKLYQQSDTQQKNEVIDNKMEQNQKNEKKIKKINTDILPNIIDQFIYINQNKRCKTMTNNQKLLYSNQKEQQNIFDIKIKKIKNDKINNKSQSYAFTFKKTLQLNKKKSQQPILSPLQFARNSNINSNKRQNTKSKSKSKSKNKNKNKKHIQQHKRGKSYKDKNFASQPLLGGIVVDMGTISVKKK